MFKLTFVLGFLALSSFSTNADTLYCAHFGEPVIDIDIRLESLTGSIEMHGEVTNMTCTITPSLSINCVADAPGWRYTIEVNEARTMANIWRSEMGGTGAVVDEYIGEGVCF